MLSAETAAGKYPVETVETMAQICIEAERAEKVRLDADFTNKHFGRIDQTIGMGALFTAYYPGLRRPRQGAGAARARAGRLTH